MKPYAFGADLDRTVIRLMLFETSGTLLEQWEIPLQIENKTILSDISDAIMQKARERRLSLLDVEGISLGVPGAVTEDGVVSGCESLGWDSFNVERRMSIITGLRTRAGSSLHTSKDRVSDSLNRLVSTK